MPTCMGTFMDLADKSHVSLMMCTSGDCQDKGWYTTDTVSVALRGNLDQLSHFFGTLASSKSLVSCQSLKIAKGGQDLFTLHCALSLIAPKVG